MDFALFRKMDLNDMVPVEVPAHIWIGFLSSYAATGWTCNATSAIAQAAQETLLDPLFLNERLAEDQAEEHKAQQIRARMFPFLRGPEIPPDAGSLTDG